MPAENKKQNLTAASWATKMQAAGRKAAAQYTKMEKATATNRRHTCKTLLGGGTEPRPTASREAANGHLLEHARPRWAAGLNLALQPTRRREKSRLLEHAHAHGSKDKATEQPGAWNGCPPHTHTHTHTPVLA